MLLFLMSSLGNEDEKKTFEYYYKTYSRQMFYVAKSVLGNDSDAEDAVHNAFVGIAKHVDILLSVNEKTGRSYCMTAARNAALNIIRDNGINNMVSLEEFYNVPDEKAFEEMLERAEYSEVLSALKNLDEKYRDVLYLKYVMDMSVKKIAQVLDRSESAVKQQLARGRSKLISALTEEVMTANEKQ